MKGYRQPNTQTGTNAEKLAMDWLIEKRYEIIATNWRYARFEIDIIATQENILHFIEVKSLSTDEVVNPEVHVTKKKFQSLKKAASAFLSQHKKYSHVQFDVLSITMKAGASPEFFLIEDVYL